MNTAFSADEKKMIPTVTVSTAENPNSSSSPGIATKDQVFLLSIAEANKYFANDGERQCKPTLYTITQGCGLSKETGYCLWWLRSPGFGDGLAAFVDYDGSVYSDGPVIYGNFAVRPALWIDLAS